MIRPLICRITVVLIALGSCQSLLAQAQMANLPARESNSELDSAFEKLTSKKAIAEVARYRKALKKLETDSQKEKDRLRNDLLGQFDIALRTATKDKDYAEVQNLLDARSLLEKAGAQENEEVGSDDDSTDAGKSAGTDNAENEEQPEPGRKRPRVPRRRDTSGRDGAMDIPVGNIQGRSSKINIAKAKTFRKNKYLVFPEHVTWHHAVRICRQHGGHLVRVGDADEQAFLVKLLTSVDSKYDSFWIDASDEEAESQWHNSLGEPLSYANWDSGQPNNGDNLQHYANMRRDLGGKWNDDVSSKRRRFICEWEGGQRAKVDVPEKAVTFRKNKYLVISESATWHVAHRVCKQLGGHLVRVDDADEQAFLEKLANATGSKRDMIWIDGSDEETESEWRNSLGQPLPYKNWDGGQPNNENQTEHHAAMRRGRGWKWTDTRATVRARYICEWENAEGQE